HFVGKSVQGVDGCSERPVHENPLARGMGDLGTALQTEVLELIPGEVPVLEHRDEHIRASTLEVEAATILPEAVRLAGISCLYDQVRPVEGDQACERRARELRVPEQRGGQLC